MFQSFEIHLFSQNKVIPGSFQVSTRLYPRNVIRNIKCLWKKKLQQIRKIHWKNLQTYPWNVGTPKPKSFKKDGWKWLWKSNHFPSKDLLHPIETTIWLVVSTHLKNISQNGNLPQAGVKIKDVWNHHLAINGWQSGSRSKIVLSWFWFFRHFPAS